MHVRLAFAVAAHLEPEILIVDEVLAVGDAEFQKKCLGKMDDAAHNGRTVLFVSHNMGAVEQLCSRAILLHGGTLQVDSMTKDVINQYLKHNILLSDWKQSFKGTLTSSVEIFNIFINGASHDKSISVAPSEPIEFLIAGRCKRKVPSFRLTLSLFREGVRVLTLHDSPFPQTLEESEFESVYKIPRYLLRPGEYYIAIGGYEDGTNEYFWGTNLSFFTIREEWDENYDSKSFGFVNISQFGVRRLKRTEN
jgi:lipopolysaccharide transport system ATP-binding protein